MQQRLQNTSNINSQPAIMQTPNMQPNYSGHRNEGMNLDISSITVDDETVIGGLHSQQTGASGVGMPSL